jgi:hypothetical protein
MISAKRLSVVAVLLLGDSNGNPLPATDSLAKTQDHSFLETMGNLGSKISTLGLSILNKKQV